MLTIAHIITVGNTHVELNADEARVVIRGDVPRRLADSLATRGVTLPPRGTIQFHIEGRQGDVVVFRSECHMRRVA